MAYKVFRKIEGGRNSTRQREGKSKIILTAKQNSRCNSHLAREGGAGLSPGEAGPGTRVRSGYLSLRSLSPPLVGPGDLPGQGHSLSRREHRQADGRPLATCGPACQPRLPARAPRCLGPGVGREPPGFSPRLLPTSLTLPTVPSCRQRTSRCPPLPNVLNPPPPRLQARVPGSSLGPSQSSPRSRTRSFRKTILSQHLPPGGTQLPMTQTPARFWAFPCPSASKPFWFHPLNIGQIRLLLSIPRTVSLGQATGVSSGRPGFHPRQLLARSHPFPRAAGRTLETHRSERVLRFRTRLSTQAPAPSPCVLVEPEMSRILPRRRASARDKHLCFGF